jgi:hypothetical protein
MKKHWAACVFVGIVLSFFIDYGQKHWDEYSAKTRLEEKEQDIKTLREERYSLREKDVDLMAVNGVLEGKLSSLRIQLQNAENAYAPWKQLAMDKFPNDSPLQAVTNLLRLLTHEIPNLPRITLTTLRGLPPEKTNNPNLKEFELIIRNANDVAIDNFCSRLQLPESIVETQGNPEKSVGTQIEWKALINTNILVKGGNGGRSDHGSWFAGGEVFPLYVQPCFFPKGPRWRKQAFMTGITTGIWELQIDKMPPGGYVLIRFITSKAIEFTNYITFVNEPVYAGFTNASPQVTDPNELRFSFEGQYQFQSEIKPGTQHFFVPLVFDPTNRSLSSLPIQADVGSWHPVFFRF